MHQKQSCDYLQDDFIDEGGRKIHIYKIYKEKKKKGKQNIQKERVNLDDCLFI